MVTGIRLLALDNKLVIAASKLGKAKTVTQMLTIILLLVNKYPFTLLGDLAGEIAGLVMISLAGVLTLVSGIDYFVKNKEIILRSK